MSTVLNTQPIFTGDVSKGFCFVKSETAIPLPGSAVIPLLYEAGSLGALIESIQIHYLNWGATEAANKLFLYSELKNDDTRYCISQTTIAANNSTSSIPSPIDVLLPPILFGENKRALKLSGGEKLYVALQNASPTGFNVIAIGGNY